MSKKADPARAMLHKTLAAFRDAQQRWSFGDCECHGDLDDDAVENEGVDEELRRVPYELRPLVEIQREIEEFLDEAGEPSEHDSAAEEAPAIRDPDRCVCGAPLFDGDGRPLYALQWWCSAWCKRADEREGAQAHLMEFQRELDGGSDLSDDDVQHLIHGWAELWLTAVTRQERAHVEDGARFAWMLVTDYMRARRDLQAGPVRGAPGDIPV